MNNREEIWKDIPDFEGIYQASNLGNIRSLDRTYKDKIGKQYNRKGVLLKPNTDKGGYLYVGLCPPNKEKIKTVKIHRLVALTFCSGYEQGLEVNHINGNRSDNRAENLEWVTRAYNNRDRYNRGYKNPTGEKSISAKLKEEYIDIIFSLYNSGVNQTIIAKAFKVSQATISHLITNKTYNNP